MIHLSGLFIFWCFCRNVLRLRKCLQFLDLFGDAASIKKADDRHAKLFLRHRTSSDSKKRQADDYLVSEKTKLAKSAVAASNPSVAGAFPGAQNQWPAGYGVQGQTWPQAAQAQPQQWNPGYAQQVTVSLKMVCPSGSNLSLECGSGYASQNNAMWNHYICVAHALTNMLI